MGRSRVDQSSSHFVNRFDLGIFIYLIRRFTVENNYTYIPTSIAATFEEKIKGYDTPIIFINLILRRPNRFPSSWSAGLAIEYLLILRVVLILFSICVEIQSTR